MKVLVQWARRNPQDWEEIEARDWASLPKRAAPPGNGRHGGHDNLPGWVCDLNVQGVHFNGQDHIAVEPITIGAEEGVRVTAWNDDPEDWPVGERSAHVWTFLPLAPDPNLGGAINTRQFQLIYAEGERFARLDAAMPQNTSLRPYSEFVPPAESLVRHGVWLEDEKWEEHRRSSRSFQGDRDEVGWRHWCDHLPEDECERDGRGRRMLKAQRQRGRYSIPSHTLTYYQRDTDRAIGFSAFTHEDALETTAGSGTTESVTLNNGTVLAWHHSTPTNEPNVASWPSGTYRSQYDITAISGGSQLGTATQGTLALRMNSALSASVNSSIGANEADATGTGLKLFTVSWSPTGSTASDRFGIRVSGTGDSHGDAITIRFSSDAFADGPWSSGLAENATPITTRATFTTPSNLLTNAPTPITARATFTTPSNLLTKAVSPVTVQTTFPQAVGVLTRIENATPITTQTVFTTPSNLLTNTRTPITTQVAFTTPARTLTPATATPIPVQAVFTTPSQLLINTHTPMSVLAIFTSLSTLLTWADAPMVINVVFITPTNTLTNTPTPMSVLITMPEAIGTLGGGTINENAIPIIVSAAFTTPSQLLTNMHSPMSVLTTFTSPSNLLTNALSPMSVRATFTTPSNLLTNTLLPMNVQTAFTQAVYSLLRTENATPIVVQTAFAAISSLLTNSRNPILTSVAMVAPAVTLSLNHTPIVVQAVFTQQSTSLINIITPILVQAIFTSPSNLLSLSSTPISVLLTMPQASGDLGAINRQADPILVSTLFTSPSTILENIRSPISILANFNTSSNALISEAVPIITRAAFTSPSTLMLNSHSPILTRAVFTTPANLLSKTASPMFVVLTMPQSIGNIGGTITENATPILVVVSMALSSGIVIDVVVPITSGLIELEDLIDRQIWPDNVDPTGVIFPIEEVIPSGFQKDPNGTELWNL